MTLSSVWVKLKDLMSPNGFDCHPFKIMWYNERVAPIFRLDLPDDTIAFVVISRPDMFEKAFMPYITKQDCLSSISDPIDECVAHHFARVKETFADRDLQIIHDFDLTHSRRPRVLVQTAGHVSGAAYYYQRHDVVNDPWPPEKKIFGVSIHPKYGGWFAFRGIIIFRDVQCAELEQTLPEDVVRSDEQKIDLLNRFNGNWRDWSFRDIVPVEGRYSDNQKLYFATLPGERGVIVEQLRAASALPLSNNIQ